MSRGIPFLLRIDGTFSHVTVAEHVKTYAWWAMKGAIRVSRGHPAPVADFPNYALEVLNGLTGKEKDWRGANLLMFEDARKEFNRRRKEYANGTN